MSKRLSINSSAESLHTLEVSNAQNQYLTFVLANEEYGVEILKVVEIRGWEKTTPIPASPKFIKGVINLRGNIIPVMDLRERLGLPIGDYNISTVVIVLQLIMKNKKRVLGIIVDAVSDVYTVNQNSIQPKPDMYSSIDDEYILGLVNIHNENKEDKLVILMNTEKLLDIENIQSLENIQDVNSNDNK